LESVILYYRKSEGGRERDRKRRRVRGDDFSSKVGEGVVEERREISGNLCIFETPWHGI
jgi:hypothetical protein